MSFRMAAAMSGFARSASSRLGAKKGSCPGRKCALLAFGLPATAAMTAEVWEHAPMPLKFFNDSHGSLPFPRSVKSAAVTPSGWPAARHLGHPPAKPGRGTIGPFVPADEARRRARWRWAARRFCSRFQPIAQRWLQVRTRGCTASLSGWISPWHSRHSTSHLLVRVYHRG